MKAPPYVAISKMQKYKYKGKKYKVKDSPRKNKQKVAITPKGKKIHFGDPSMKEYPGTKRGDKYCARSYGIAKKNNIKKDPKSSNFWSRKYLWNCKNKKSLNSRKKAGLKKA